MSGSRNARETSTATAPSGARSRRAASVPTASGGRFGPSLSRRVTVVDSLQGGYWLVHQLGSNAMRSVSAASTWPSSAAVTVKVA